MTRLVCFLMIVCSLAACRYDPLDFRENIPEVGDAVIDRELAIFGESRISYYNGNNHLCTLVTDIEGYVEEESLILELKPVIEDELWHHQMYTSRHKTNPHSQQQTRVILAW